MPDNNEARIEALRQAVQAWLDEIPGNTATFHSHDAEAVMGAVDGAAG